MQHTESEQLAKQNEPIILSEATASSSAATAPSSETTASTQHPQKQSKGFGVAASPFNGIKLELGICFILGAILWLGADSITANEGAQLLILLGYGLLGATWLTVRTRRVLRRCEAEQNVQ